MIHTMLKTVLLLLAGLLSTACDSSDSEHAGHGQAPAASASGRKIKFYKSPMDPSFISTKPGKDGMGMDLLPVYEGDPAANLDVIEVKGATLQKMGVRVAAVKRGTLTRIIRAFGRVDFDEARIATVNMKFDGWIEKLYVNETGQPVKKGQPLFAVYSPELVASQQEYVQILKSDLQGPHSAHLKKSARQRLMQFDIPKGFVDRIENKKSAQRSLVFGSPKGGFVIHKTAVEGTFVKQGANLFTIADLNALWILADVYEFDAPWVVVGQEATVELDYLPGQDQEASVEYIYPTLDQKSRTLQVRLRLPNPKIALKPGMFATVRIHAKPVGEALLVPSEAVIHSGERHIAFVSKGKGLFEPRDLELGVRGDQNYQVLAGLEEGEKVVVSGQFLLDSESRLKEAVKKMLGSNLASKHDGSREHAAPAPSSSIQSDMEAEAASPPTSAMPMPRGHAPQGSHAEQDH